MKLKKELALLVTSEITSKEAAEKAQRYFEDVFQKKEIAEDIPEIAVEEGNITLTDLISSVNLTDSKSQARRLVEQGAVEINGETQTQWDKGIDLTSHTPITLKVGRKMLKIYQKE